MTTKDYLEITYWIVSVFILSATVFYIYYAPIKAVKIGRQLNEEQNQYNVKRQLFFTLYSHRGTPIHHNFVKALNNIDLVFQKESSVLEAWHKYYNALEQEETTLSAKTWEFLRVEMLSAMAHSLGYEGLSQVNILKHYYPLGHKNDEDYRDEFRQSAKRFFDMAHSLGYEGFSQGNLMNRYNSLGQNNDEDYRDEFRQSAKRFFDMVHALHLSLFQEQTKSEQE